jgi:quercetin dioxygenase-like cupin family protein
MREADEEYKPVGRFRYPREATLYEKFMEEQEIPIVRGVGIYDTRNVTLASWKRMGGQGAFIQLDGTGGLTGMFLVEVPPGGTLNPEKHIYDELYWVVEGRGSTEIWAEGSSRKLSFEWQAGSIFSPPANTWHRIINAASSPALLLGVNNAPPLFNVHRNQGFIFNNPFHFKDRFDEREDYFKPNEELERSPLSGRAGLRTNLLPDTVNCELPYDGQRGVGHRNFSLNMSGNTFNGFIAEYPAGRYSKCHYHESGPVLLCLKGKGYSITWPLSAGTRPWEAGNGHLVKRQDYVPGGLVSAAPGETNWYHGHYGAGKEPLRVMAFLGGYPRRTFGAPGDEHVWNADVNEGGNTIEYFDEDPQIRRMFIEALEKDNAEFHMPESVFQKPTRVASPGS